MLFLNQFREINWNPKLETVWVIQIFGIIVKCFFVRVHAAQVSPSRGIAANGTSTHLVR